MCQLEKRELEQGSFYLININDLFCFQGVMVFFGPLRVSSGVRLSHFYHLSVSVQTAVGWWEGDTVMSSVSILRVNVL